MRKLILLGLILAAIAAGALLYPGAVVTYLLFSLVFFAILLSGLYLPFQYSHLFLAVIWFIGFWLKLVVHFAFSHYDFVKAAKYIEPSGSFDGSGRSWDMVLLIAAIGGLGYLAGRVVVLPIVQRQSSLVDVVAPSWYPQLKTLLWSLAVIALVVILLANAEMGLVVRGYVPSVQLPWPLGGLFAWTTDIGLALTITVLTAWDRSAGVGLYRGFLALCIEGAAISVATNSRGIYLFHTLPVLVSESGRMFFRPQFRRAGILLLVWLIGAVTIPLVTTGLRAFGEAAFLAKVESGSASVTTPALTSTPAAPPSSAGSAPATAAPAPARSEVIRAFLLYAFEGGSRLIIDRWVGMEGLMSAVSYPDRGLPLFLEAALQRRTFGMVDVYTGKISQSDFSEEQAKTYHNATLAGPIAFFYFSGSKLLVFGGMALIAALMSVLEIIWRNLFRDRLVAAMSGFYLALVVMQLSTGIIQAITGPVAVTALLGAVWCIARIGTGSRQAQLAGAGAGQRLS